MFHGNDPNKNLVLEIYENLQLKKRHFKYIKYKNSFNHQCATIWNKSTDDIKKMDFDKLKTNITKSAQLLEKIDINA